nr:hypothetical protein [Kineococcus aurantiacus]
MGEQRTPELGTPGPGGRYQLFDFGAIHHSPGTGAHEVHGAIAEKFAALGWEAGALGYPTTDELRTPDGRGRFNHFERGSVYWTRETGACAVVGAIRESWRALGWEAGALGYPTTDELGTPDGRGRFTHFEHGSVYWTAATGARAVRGAIREEWEAWGWEAGPLGYPTTDELPTPDGRGRFTHFTGTPAAPGGSVHWSPRTGARAVLGAVRDAWAYLGWEGGRLGYPVTSQARTPDGRAVYNHFEHGSVYASADTGAHAVTGAVLDRWRATGWEAGPLGLPTTDETAVAGGSFENFENGSIYVSAATGAHTVSGPVRQAFRDAGGPARWGFPTGEPEPVSAGQVRQAFERGTAVLTVATGAVRFG